METLINTFRSRDKFSPSLITFFVAAGVPKELLETFPSALAEVKYYTCFVSYGEPDSEICEKTR